MTQRPDVLHACAPCSRGNVDHWHVICIVATELISVQTNIAVRSDDSPTDASNRKGE
ncbi:hypothetical protein [Paraburkholderia rhizosphaerae]|uniref:Uncharacterized protein n=1 Tax=Paraburkholderia rhizosphaerae TaxID=480658 RepID=A0A4R8LH17_9BURK|nr:hypothetical protein [Paraburkholderia rhizosphaerae]TDY42471.1 hypothetical protein BX592_12142 [Paraburkholderia rhizosphaerae]